MEPFFLTRKTVKPVIAGIVLLLCIAAAVYAYIYSSCGGISCISVPGSNEWKRTEVYESSGSRYRALYTAPDMSIRVEKVYPLTAEDAAVLTKVNTMRVSGLFDETGSPYPGMISDRIRCDTEYKPVISRQTIGDLAVTSYESWLNERMETGSCIPEEKRFRSLTALFYCSDESALYKLEFIASADSSSHPGKKTLSGISCRRTRWGMFIP